MSTPSRSTKHFQTRSCDVASLGPILSLIAGTNPLLTKLLKSTDITMRSHKLSVTNLINSADTVSS